jgi:transcriptional regulator with XRE-family HTH domain
MSKRKVVKIDVDSCLRFARGKHWKAVDLAEMVGKHKNWISEVKRGRNLPSPEEAARMCGILQVTPEEILVEPEDIELVRGLIESQIPEQKETAPHPGSGKIPNFEKLSAANKAIIETMIDQLLAAQSSEE